MSDNSWLKREISSSDLFDVVAHSTNSKYRLNHSDGSTLNNTDTYDFNSKNIGFEGNYAGIRFEGTSKKYTVTTDNGNFEILKHNASTGNWEATFNPFTFKR